MDMDMTDIDTPDELPSTAVDVNAGFGRLRASISM